MVGSNTETGISVTYDDSDNTLDFVIGSGVITNAMLAGSIANSKLSNSSITVSDGSNTTAISLGGTLTFSGTSNEVLVVVQPMVSKYLKVLLLLKMVVHNHM